MRLSPKFPIITCLSRFEIFLNMQYFMCFSLKKKFSAQQQMTHLLHYLAKLLNRILDSFIRIVTNRSVSQKY